MLTEKETGGIFGRWIIYVLSWSLHKTCEIANPHWQEKTKEERRSEMQDFTCPKKEPIINDSYLDAGKLCHMQKIEELMIQKIVSNSTLFPPTFTAVKTEMPNTLLNGYKTQFYGAFSKSIFQKPINKYFLPHIMLHI